jgi:polyphosphate kinase
MLLTSVVAGVRRSALPGMSVRSVHQFRVTRNSELFVDDEEITDLRAALQGELPQRRYGDVGAAGGVGRVPDVVVERLLREFELSEHELFRVTGPV